MKPKSSTPWAWIIAGLLLLAGVGGMGLIFIAATVAGGVGGQVGLIEVTGVITGETTSGVFGSAPGSQDFIDDMERARRDDTIKAVVIRINSPGGSAAASQEMFQAVQRLREAKPVVCSMGDVAASGGYYIAAGCNKIYANPATITGSIGVITQLLNYQELFNKIGLDTNTIKSGEFKDAGNPDRPLTEKERQLFQQMVTSIYEQFLDDVAEGRQNATDGRMTKAKIRPLADGRIFTGQQAQQNGLVDELGGLYEAVEAAGELGGITGRARVRKLRSSGIFSGAFSSGAESTLTRAAGSFGHAFAKGFLSRIQTETSTPARPMLQ